MCLDHVIMVDTYISDNGVFKANIFVQKICEHNQRICYCGINAHHENGVAERSIRMISEMTCAMIVNSCVNAHARTYARPSKT